MFSCRLGRAMPGALGEVGRTGSRQYKAVIGGIVVVGGILGVIGSLHADRAGELTTKTDHHGIRHWTIEQVARRANFPGENVIRHGDSALQARVQSGRKPGGERPTRVNDDTSSTPRPTESMDGARQVRQGKSGGRPSRVGFRRRGRRYRVAVVVSQGRAGH